MKNDWAYQLKMEIQLDHWILDSKILSRLIYSKDDKRRITVGGIVEKKFRVARQEEIVRQLTGIILNDYYMYPLDLISFEHPIKMGSSTKRIDVVIKKNPDTSEIHIAVEVKIEINEDAKSQLHSYMMISGAPYGMLISSTEKIFFGRNTERKIIQIKDIPLYGISNYVDSKNQQLEPVPEEAEYSRNAPIDIIEYFSDLKIKPLDSDEEKFRIHMSEESFTCTSKQVYSYPLFRRKALLNGIPFPTDIEREQWELVLQSKLKDAKKGKLDVSEQFVTLVNEFCSDARLSAAKREDLFSGRVWTESHPDKELDEMCVYFRLKDLQEFLVRNQFRSYTLSQITSRLERLMNAKRHKFHLKKTTVNVWYIPESRRVSS